MHPVVATTHEAVLEVKVFVLWLYCKYGVPVAHVKHLVESKASEQLRHDEWHSPHLLSVGLFTYPVTREHAYTHCLALWFTVDVPKCVVSGNVRGVGKFALS